MSDDQLIQLWLQEWNESGQKVRPEVLCSARPDLLPRLRDAIDAAQAAQSAVGRLVDTPTLDPTSTQGQRRPAPAPQVTAPAPSQTVPDRIGPYQIIRELGSGGMGVVYHAMQETPVRREVAIKLIRLGMDSEAVVARFDAERQAIALLNHPNIASVHDAGLTPQGRSYFVMEYVAGEPLSVFCDRHKLTVRQRLELFTQICEAVHHAHAKGIIHRDIKPANILVTMLADKPVPKLIDFGVAKAVSHRLSEKQAFTEIGQLIGTPQYMSPEQAEVGSIDIDTRSDVYSLGVVLYELLSGVPPFDPATLRAAAYGEMQRIIREVDPPKPSTRLSGLGDKGTRVAELRRVALPGLTDELRRELEWIPLKAMRKERTERYRTAIELADDIRNYLAAKPLLAGPVTAGYRIKKFIRRNRSTVSVVSAAVAAVLLTAAVAFVLVTRQRNAAIAARDAESMQRALAEKSLNAARAAVSEFFTAVSQNQLLKYRSLTPLRQQLLSLAARYHEQFIADYRADPRLRRELATSRHLLGTARQEAGDFAGAIAQLRQAVAERRALATENPLDLAVRAQVAESMINLGNALALSGQGKEANEQLAAAAELLQSLSPSQSHPAELAAANQNLASLALNAGNDAIASGAYQRAIAILERAVADDPAASLRRRELAQAHLDFGVLLAAGAPAEALKHFNSALAGFQRASIDQPDSTALLTAMAKSQTWLATIQLDLGNAQASLQSHEAAAALWRQLTDSEKHFPPDTAKAEALGFQSWTQILAAQFAPAITSAKSGIAADASQTWIKANLAHALLLSGDRAAAMKIYQENRSAALDGAETFEQHTTADLDRFIKAGFITPAVRDDVVKSCFQSGR